MPRWFSLTWSMYSETFRGIPAELLRSRRTGLHVSFNMNIKVHVETMYIYYRPWYRSYTKFKHIFKLIIFELFNLSNLISRMDLFTSIMKEFWTTKCNCSLKNKCYGLLLYSLMKFKCITCSSSIRITQEQMRFASFQRQKAIWITRRRSEGVGTIFETRLKISWLANDVLKNECKFAKVP